MPLQSLNEMEEMSVITMINQERVREMSRMAMLENGIGEKELKISSYRRIDYVILEAVKGFVAGTVCFAALFLIWFLTKWDSLNQYFASADYAGFLTRAVKGYLYFMVFYLAVCVAVAIFRHWKCTKRKKLYLQHLNCAGRTFRSGGASDEENEEE